MEIEKIHFVCNALLSQRTQFLDKKYSDFAINIRKSKSKDESSILIENLINSFKENLPSYNIFEGKFLELSYSKKIFDCNLKTKYVVQAIAKKIANTEVVPNDSSIEHIMNEDGGNTLCIGNLILLEQNINSQIPESEDFAGKKKWYDKSSYPCMRDFLLETKNNNKWDEIDIECRGKKLAEFYYVNILNGVL